MAKVKVKKERVLPEYPADHKVGMVVPEGGSMCDRCSFWDGKDCENVKFREWNGSGKIPVAPTRYCCDFFSINNKPNGKES